MPTPKSGYYVDGVRVPSVTTIISACKSSEALIYWSWNIAYAHYKEIRAMLEKIISQGGLDSGTIHDAKAILEKPDPDYRAKRNKAADVGTIVHARIECQTKGVIFDPAPYVSESIPDPMASSEAGFDAFKLWSSQTHFNLEPAEMQLTSAQYHFGGTPDQIMLINGKRSVGDYKGLSLDTVIPTAQGWTTMGEIKLGEKVFDECGKLCHVIGVSEIKRKRCFRIKFDDKSHVVCDEEHLWGVLSGSKHKLNILTAEQLLQNTFSSGQRHQRIPNSLPLDLPDVNLPIHPYILGAWLGDVAQSRGEICKPSHELWDRIAKCGATFTNTPLRNKSGQCNGRTVHGLSRQLKDANLINNKHIPASYLRASIIQRTELLRGLLDTDGYWNPIRSQVDFTNTNRLLMDGIFELIMSLGQRASFWEGNGFGFGKQVHYYKIMFNPINLNPFGWRKMTNHRPSERGSRRLVYSVEETDSVPTRCIKVDSPSAMYLCTKWMIPTHNSGNLYPDSLLPQLSAYKLLLRENGYAIDDDGAHAMSINKETGGFTHRYFTPVEMESGLEAFLLMRKLYEIKKYLK